jgi:ribonuclease E
MLDNEPTGGASTDTTSDEQNTATATATPRRRATRRAQKAAPVAGEPAATDAVVAEAPAAEEPAAPVKRARRAAKKAAPAPVANDLTAAVVEAVAAVEATDADAPAPAKKAVRKAAPRKRAAKKVAEPAAEAPAEAPPAAETPDAPAAQSDVSDSPAPAKRTRRSRSGAARAAAPDTVDSTTEAAADSAPAPVGPPVALFVAPDPAAAAPRRRGARRPAGPPEQVEAPVEEEPTEVAEADTADDEQDTEGGARRRRRGRRGRGRGRGGDENATEDDESAAEAETASPDAEDSETGEDDESDGASRRRRRRRRRGGSGGGDTDGAVEDPPNTVVKVREPRAASDEVQGVKGSTRLEAKRQRRRDGRDQGRRRPPVLSEAEFLARREAVERTMVVRQIGERTQIAVLEDDVLVEHYVTKASNTSYAGNVYLGKVQNVLPSMEAAFIDIGKGRNAVLYAGEVNWDAAGMDGKPRKIEQALKSGDPVLVQVTKDPIGHKGARLTSQISLPGRFLVYVPEGQMTGISRKLPDTERKRLKDILKKIVPENAGVIIRTAAEGASEEELASDVDRLEAQWQTIKTNAEKGQAPSLLNAEPDLVVRVIRDIFNEDFAKLIVSGDEAWNTVEEYVRHVSPDLVERLSRHTADTDVFAALRIDEQLTKALDRKVYLPSGGSLVIDRTEAMTVVDVNTGKFTGQGGNLEETVTRNNLEAAEEIVRQLRLRDIGGMIVVDFIDMVLESNRDLVLRRLTECLGRDRTKHQVAEVTSLGLVQMTRKRVGQGLLEAFSETCEHCKGRGVHVRTDLFERPRQQQVKPQPPRPVPPALSPAALETDVVETVPAGSEVAETVVSDTAAVDVDTAPVEAPPVEGGRRGRGRGRGGRGQGDGAPADAAPASDAAEPVDAVAPDAEGAAEPSAPSRRRRGRGRVTTEVVAADVAVEATPEPPSEAPLGSEPWPAVPAPDVVADPVTTTGAEATNGTTPEPAPRRRRRAASRPAGPPVAAS